MRHALVISDLHGERRVPLVGTLTVGRDPACEIYDPDAMLSRRHAQFALTARGASVKDLDSRNGIQVNGVAVHDAMLRQGDIVQIAHLRIRYEETLEEPAPEPAAGHADSTRMLDVNPEALAEVQQMSPDATRVVLPGMVGQAHVAAPAVVPAAQAAPVAAAPPVAVPARVPAAPVPAPAAPARVPAPAAPVAAGGTRAIAALAPDAAATAHTARGPWMMTVQIHTVALAILSFIVAAMPALMWHDAQLSGFAEERASALANWAAAEGRVRLESHRASADALDAILKQPGVVGALLVTLDGRILAPASRAQEQIQRLPGLNVAPSEVYRMQMGRTDDLTVTAMPVATASNPRAAVAWLSVRASDLGAQFESSGAVIAPMFLIALAASLGMGVLLHRSTTRRLASLNEDAEMAMGGQLRNVDDTLGTKATRDLASTLNYLMARVRSTAGGGEPERAALATGTSAGGPRAAAQPAAPPRHAPAAPPPPAVAAPPPAASRPAPSPAQVAQGQPQTARMAQPPPPAPVPVPAMPAARLVADAQLRVTEASESCGIVFGVPKDRALGQHVLDAVSDRPVLDAVLKCLSALPASGQHEVEAVHEATGKRIVVRVSRAGRDQPVTIEAQES